MFKKFNGQLRISNYKGLELESLVIDKMGHGSEGTYAIGRGLEFIFSKPDIMLDTVLLNQYIGHYEQGFIFTRTGSSVYVNIGGKKIRIHAATNESFYVTGVNGTIEFTKDDKGKVTGFSAKTADGTFSAKKID